MGMSLSSSVDLNFLTMCHDSAHVMAVEHVSHGCVTRHAGCDVVS